MGAVADASDRPRLRVRAGFIGLGVMGRPMAGHLLAAGFPLTVHSRSRGPVEDLVAAGAADGGSPAGVGRASDVVILMLPDPPDVHDVIFDEGLADALPPGQRSETRVAGLRKKLESWKAGPPPSPPPS